MSISVQDYERLNFKDIHIQRFLMRYEDFLNKIASGSVQECEKLGRDLMLELNSMTFMLSKSELVYDILEKDEIKENEMMKEIDREVSQTKLDIIDLQNELEVQKVIQSNKGEYESIAAVINEYNDRLTIKSKIAKSEDESRYLSKEINSIKNTLITKKKKTHLLATMLTDITVNIEGINGDKENIPMID